MTQYRNTTLTNVPDQVIGEARYDNVGSWYKFSGNLKMMFIREVFDTNDQAMSKLWDLQDGYGTPGFMPAQGIDWSGIRDSSDGAKDAMFSLACSFKDYEMFRASVLNPSPTRK